MRSSIYRVGESLVIPTTVRATAGYYLDLDPVLVIYLSAPDLPSTLGLLLERPNPLVPSPKPKEFPAPVVLKPAGFRTWKAFANAAESWKVNKEGAEYKVSHLRRGDRNAFYPTAANWIIPEDASGQLAHVHQILSLIQTHEHPID